ncbi:MAG: hypothetical protein PHI63_05580 [Patescibacteria group bacterium]|nr:hypothetical protein [Patescibacteria group bacterium]
MPAIHQPEEIRDALCKAWGISTDELWMVPDDVELSPNADAKFLVMQDWWETVKSVPPGI